MGIEKLTFAGFEVILNSELLRINEATLSQYIQTEAGYYDNFGAFQALAEKNLQNKEMFHERLYSERFIEAKEAGGTEKLAEARAKADPDVLSAKQDIIDARYIVNRLKQHLKAWDKNHENAQSMGHMQRKMLDKLNSDIVMRGGLADLGIAGLDQAIEDTVTPFEEKEVEPTDETPEFETELSLDNMF